MTYWFDTFYRLFFFHDCQTDIAQSKNISMSLQQDQLTGLTQNHKVTQTSAYF